MPKLNVALLALLIPLTACALAAPRRAADAAPAVTAAVTVDTTAKAKKIAPDFLGLSFEKEQVLDGDFTESNKALLRFLGNLGPGTLRIGGNSVDVMSYPGQHPDASCRIEKSVDPGKTRAMFAFAKKLGWKVIYTLDLGCYDPGTAAEEARFVMDNEQGQLLAFEIGNEPDLFPYQKLREAGNWNPDAYIRQFTAYAAAIRKAASTAPIGGPGAANLLESGDWTNALLSATTAQPPPLVFASAHFYPWVRGLPPDSPFYPTREKLLDHRFAGKIIKRFFQPQAAEAERYKLPFRITEMNSVARSGQAGVSDAFTSALWFLDYAYLLAGTGVSGVDIQNDLHNLHDIYSPLQMEGGEYRPRPLYYGMLMFGRSAAGQLVATTVAGGESLNLSAYSTLGEDGRLRVLLINKDPARGVRAELTVSGNGFTSGEVLRLEAPSLDSKTGVTLGGAAVKKNGTWTPEETETVSRSMQDKPFTVNLRAASAVCLVLR